jgi:hypothetical protein
LLERLPSLANNQTGIRQTLENKPCMSDVLIAAIPLTYREIILFKPSANRPPKARNTTQLNVSNAENR